MHGCLTFIWAEIHCYLSTLKSWHDNPFLSGVNCFHITSYLKADLYKSVHISKKNNNFILTYDLLDRTHAQCACGIFWICLIKSLIPLCAQIALYWMPNLKNKSRVDFDIHNRYIECKVFECFIHLSSEIKIQFINSLTLSCTHMETLLIIYRNIRV